MKIVFATGNPGKLQEAAAILGEGFELVTPAEVGITEEIPETGTTLRANSQQKADYIYKKTGLDCFADDSGLEVDILGGAPGVETARYAGPERDANANMDKLLSKMAHGKGGFGYDPIFVPEGYTQTNAELGDKVKNAISHRSKALRAMAEYLREQH